MLACFFTGGEQGDTEELTRTRVMRVRGGVNSRRPCQQRLVVLERGPSRLHSTLGLRVGVTHDGSPSCDLILSLSLPRYFLDASKYSRPLVVFSFLLLQYDTLQSSHPRAPARRRQRSRVQREAIARRRASLLATPQAPFVGLDVVSGTHKGRPKLRSTNNGAKSTVGDEKRKEQEQEQRSGSPTT